MPMHTGHCMHSLCATWHNAQPYRPGGANSSLLGVPLGRLANLLTDAMHTSAVAQSAALVHASASQRRAATPAACGVAGKAHKRDKDNQQWR
jgi:hypothetical protein